MSNPFLAEIRIFTGGFAPKGWALCDGQLMSISQNTALFSLLGTTYGGNGTSNFALPNLQGCAPMQAGQGPGLSLRDLGETAGEQTVTLLQTEMPAHVHGAVAATGSDQGAPPNNAWASGTKFTGVNVYAPSDPQNNQQMNPFALSIAGGSLPHNNMTPFLGLTFIIALQGVFPARS
ncbi:MAG TPA: tail fiber protein [Candidatus Angelobacter sp.]